jgi:hypothetical protein
MAAIIVSRQVEREERSSRSDHEDTPRTFPGRAGPQLLVCAGDVRRRGSGTCLCLGVDGQHSQHLPLGTTWLALRQRCRKRPPTAGRYWRVNGYGRRHGVFDYRRRAVHGVSAQFGPKLLCNYMRASGNQIVCWARLSQT